MHLALDPANAVAIAKANGIAPLVNTLEDGPRLLTSMLLRRSSVCRWTVQKIKCTLQSHEGLPASPSTGAQCRTARLFDLAANNEGARLGCERRCHLTTRGFTNSWPDVKREAERASKNLSELSFNAACDCDGPRLTLGHEHTGNSGAHHDAIADVGERRGELRSRVSNAGNSSYGHTFIEKGNITFQAQEPAAVLAKLSPASESNVDKISEAAGTNPLIL